MIFFVDKDFFCDIKFVYLRDGFWLVVIGNHIITG